MNDYFIIYGLTIISLIITIASRIFIDVSYKKYLKVDNQKGITGKTAARNVLNNNNLEKININEVGGYLTDHYNPTNKTVSLSQDIYNNTSIASVAVACHECGHAIQDKDNYIFMRIREKLVPIVNFSSYAGYIAILLGSIFGALELIWLGIILELAILLFQIVTLPVEIDASRRALKQLKTLDILTTKELNQARIMLIAAALTYVASVATTLIQILRLVLIYTRRDRR